MRFLGIRVTSTGGFLPWREDFTKSMYGVKGRLTNAGLGSLPAALSRALQVKVLPAMLYGCEIWACSWLAEVLRGK